MKIELLAPDAPPDLGRQAPGDASAFVNILDDIGSALGHASDAENAYASGKGNLADAVYERARADVVLSVATAAAQRTAQALNTVLNMQI